MSTEYSKLNGLILPTPLLDEIKDFKQTRFGRSRAH